MILDYYPRLLEHLGTAATLAEKMGDRARLADVLARMLTPLRIEGPDRSGDRAWRASVGPGQEVGDARLDALVGMELSPSSSTVVTCAGARPCCSRLCSRSTRCRCTLATPIAPGSGAGSSRGSSGCWP